MKLHYYPDTDSLDIELKSTPGGKTREIAPAPTSTSTPLVTSSASTSTAPPAASI